MGRQGKRHDAPEQGQSGVGAHGIVGNAQRGKLLQECSVLLTGLGGGGVLAVRTGRSAYLKADADVGDKSVKTIRSEQGGRSPVV